MFPNRKGLEAKRKKYIIRYLILGVSLTLVWMTQSVPGWGEFYARHIYPTISFILSSFSRLIPFALGDLFIFLSIAGLIFYTFFARLHKKKRWRTVLLRDAEYLLWVYVWFYFAWGLNYSQDGFYQRTGIPYTKYTDENFQFFMKQYVINLNQSYTSFSEVDRKIVCKETVSGYKRITNTLGVNQPHHASPQVKTMLFTPLASKVGVTGSMGPFFCEYTVNGDILPASYPSTYAHEFAHLLGITSEAEANFYAYQVCTQSEVKEIRFSGYFSILPHVLGNARRLLSEDEYKQVLEEIHPDIINLAQEHQVYWSNKYSPLIGNIQRWFYDLYLKGNKISSGHKNYSEVVGLLISHQEWEKEKSDT